MSKFLDRQSEGWQCARDTMFNRMVSNLQVSKQKYRLAKSSRTSFTEETLSEEKLQQYEETTTKDETTGVYNSRFFATRLIREVKRSKRYKRPFSLMLVYLDNLLPMKKLGELNTKNILSETADLVKTSVRNVDLVARLSFNSFAVILPETDSSRAILVGQRINEQVNKRLINRQLKDLQVTTKIGVVSFPSHGRDENALLALAAQFVKEAQKQPDTAIYTV
jgi:diguanylate cyclase (GGDEF)-like protein